MSFAKRDAVSMQEKVLLRRKPGHRAVAMGTRLFVDGFYCVQTEQLHMLDVSEPLLHELEEMDGIKSEIGVVLARIVSEVVRDVVLW